LDKWKLKKKIGFFCETCDSISYSYDCCGNSACNGSGCDKCKGYNSIIWKLVDEGKCPSKDEVPHKNDGLDV